MKYHKKMAYLLFLMLFASDAYAMKKREQHYSYLSHPTTLFCAGLTSLGGYCLYDKEASLQAYEWLKQRFDEIPGIVKIGGFGLGLWAWYTLWFNKKRSHLSTPEQERRGMHEPIAEDSDSEKEKQGDNEKATKRLKVLEESVLDIKVSFAAYEARYKQDTTKINNRLGQLEETNEQNEALKKESMDFFEEIVDNIESLKKPIQLFDQNKDNDEMGEKEARKKINYIVVPEEILINFGNRMSNLEIVVLGAVTTPKSFGVDAELKLSRIDLLEKKVDDVEKITKMMFKKRFNKEKDNNLTAKRLLPLPSAARGLVRKKGDEGEKYH